MAGEAESTDKAKRGWRWLALFGLVLCLGAVGVYRLRDYIIPAQAEPPPVADVSSERLLALGGVVGFATPSETHAWLGLPYARPPVDALRWRAPRPAAAWADTRDALSFGAPCLQVGSMIGGVPAEDAAGYAGQEDCLTLNVWAPRSEVEGVPTGDDRWPVMVWIHGGGNTRGYAGSRIYDGAHLAGREGVVVVSLNYRLGPMGWFSHPALRALAADPYEASGNFGTLDQIEALQWVQDHIGEFGGDPTNVTLFGESAGGLDVYALMLAEPAKGLFHRAIVQSGATDAVQRSEAENAVDAAEPGWQQSSSEIVVKLLQSEGAVPDRDAARRYAVDLPASDLVEWLRSRDGRAVLGAYRQPNSDSLVVPKPIRDGVLLPTEPFIDALRDGRGHRVPLLAGINRDEEKIFLSQKDEHVARSLDLFYRIRDPEAFELRARAQSDFWAVRGVIEPAQALVAAGYDDVFAYRFDWDELPMLLGQDMSQLLGAAHGFEMPLLFGTFDLGDPVMSRLLYPDEGRDGRERLSSQMMSYWAAFARDGRPGQGSRGELPRWLPWSIQGVDGQRILGLGRWMILDSESGGGLRLEPTSLSRAAVIATIDAAPELSRRGRCALFEDVFRFDESWTDEAYQEMGREGCSGVPLHGVAR